MSDEQEKINFTTERMLAKYAAGVQVADIADDFETSYDAVYELMREHPDEYAEAKLELLKHRNAKHRRINAVATDISLNWLTHIKENCDIKELSAKDVSAIQKIGEAADRRADLNEGKATEITESKGTIMEIIFPDGFKPENEI
jgi:predicted DNA-binding protein YlxM (UPF0122 family)